ncbi:MAG: hypothetical protein LBK54_11565 [Propionibacteriaceae bacterium]|nr:hypothetical protein [Propionibacteriaceae bacterium]
MFELNEDTIQAGIDIIAGSIVTEAAGRLGRPIDEVAHSFYESTVYAQLSDPETGRYWDSLPELLDLFLAEVATGAVAERAV